MEINAKKLVSPIIYILSGVFGFIFMALDFIVAHASGHSAGLANAYKFIGLSSAYLKVPFFKDLAGILLVIGIIVCIVLILIGVVKLLTALNFEIVGVSDILPKINKYFSLALIANLAIFGGAFISSLIFELANSVSYGGYAPGVGAYLLLIFAAAAFAGESVLSKKFGEELAENAPNAPKTVYVCTSCGKKCKPGTNFCDACGKPVEAKVAYPTVYVCSACGKKAKAGTNFCDACGKPIVKKELVPTAYVCSACGAPAAKDSKFCASCGEAVVEKKSDTEN